MLFIEVLELTKSTIRFTVVANKGDAPSYGITGEHTLPLIDCHSLARRDETLSRAHDELVVPPTVLEELAKKSWAVQE